MDVRKVRMIGGPAELTSDIYLWSDLTCMIFKDGGQYELKSDGNYHWRSGLVITTIQSTQSNSCECGGSKTKTGHSHWCPMFGK